MAKNKDRNKKDIEFDKLCEDAYDGLKIKVYALTNGDIYMTEEIVQDTYEIALKKKAELLAHPNFDGWLYRTARNKLNVKLRKNRRYVQIQKQLPLDVSKDPMFNEENIRTLNKIMSELSQKEREILRLEFTDKLTLKEISAKVDENYENLREYNYRLLTKIKKLFFDKDKDKDKC